MVIDNNGTFACVNINYVVICRYVQFENIAIVHHCLGLLKGELCSNLECDALSELDCFIVELPLDIQLQEHFKGNNYICNYH